MSASKSNSNSDDHGHGHVIPIKFFVLNLMALMTLMVVTILVSFVDLTSWGNNIIAMLIAGTKATLVVCIFMGVWWASKLAKLYAMLGFVWVFFLGIMFCDYGSRHLEFEKGWEGQKQVYPTGMNAPVVDPVAVSKAHVTGEGGGH